MSIRPFDSGTQFQDWTASNCDRCTKGSHRLEEDEWPDCPIESALVYALFGDGSITQEFADRMGYKQFYYGWKCGEFEPTEEWKAEYRRRKAEKEKDVG